MSRLIRQNMKSIVTSKMTMYVHTYLAVMIMNYSLISFFPSLTHSLLLYLRCFYVSCSSMFELISFVNFLKTLYSTQDGIGDEDFDVADNANHNENAKRPVLTFL